MLRLHLFNEEICSNSNDFTLCGILYKQLIVIEDNYGNLKTIKSWTMRPKRYKSKNG